MKPTSRPFLRFLAVGGFNTLCSYIIYLLVLQAFHYQVAYSLAYCCGIVIAYSLNSRFVFDVPWSWSGLLRFPLVYVFQYAVGAICLWMIVEVMGFDKVLAPIVVVALTVPLTYLLAGRILRWRGHNGPPSYR